MAPLPFHEAAANAGIIAPATTRNPPDAAFRSGTLISMIDSDRLVIERFRLASEEFQARLTVIRPDQWRLPIPCPTATSAIWSAT